MLELALNQNRITEQQFEQKKGPFVAEPPAFDLQTTTVWSFPKRGEWATHKGDYRGNWAPEIPRNLILRYSKKGDVVLDPFVGSGTTIVEAKLLGRKGIGLDINKDAIKLAQARTKFEHSSAIEPTLKVADVRNVEEVIGTGKVDLICAHPPYADIISYSENNPADLSSLNVGLFVKEIGPIAQKLYNVLKPNGFCAILIGDMRKKGHVIPLGFNVLNAFTSAGFVPKEIIIKEQHNCRTTGFWRSQSEKFNFLLLAHEYLFVLRKE